MPLVLALLALGAGNQALAPEPQVKIIEAQGVGAEGEPFPITCTAWAVAPTQIVTAAHCLGDGTKITDSGTQLRPFKANRFLDVAVLETPEEQPLYFTMAAEGPALGDPVTVKSRVHYEEHGRVAVPGFFVRVGVPSHFSRVNFITPRIVPGQSGSPVLNRHGRVVGLASAVYGPMTIIVNYQALMDFIYDKDRPS